MTYVVGWSPFHRDAGAVDLACRLARSVGERLHVVSVFPSAWGGLGRRGTDESVEREGARAGAEARAFLDEAGVEGDVVCVSARSVPHALLGAVEETSASMLVLGSGGDAGLGHISLSSKSSRLLHSSPVPVALAPRGHHGRGAAVTRVTCAYRDVDSARSALERSVDFARRAGAQVRVVTFGVEPRRMYPAEVSGAESMVLDEWRTQADAALSRAVADLAPDAAGGEIAVGRTWADALYAVEWTEGDVLVVGSSSTIPLAQVFLGSSASKIVRHSPVPVVVMPGSAG